MANQRQPDTSGFTAETDIDLVLGNANPNPTRTGCPSDDVLTALARRERSVDDPAYDHLTKCSPCYRRVRALQQGIGERRGSVAWRTWRLAAVAAIIVVGIVGASWFGLHRGELPRPSAELEAELDLRPYAIMRGGESQVEQKPLVLPRGRLVLRVLLPVGSEPGSYEVQLLDSNLSSKASASGDADLQNQITTLRTALDATALSPGDYKLAVRHSGNDWQLFPAQVK